MPFVVLGATRAFFVALVLMFLYNLLLLIIGQGPPVLVKPCEYLSIHCTNAGFWGPVSGGIFIFVMGTSVSTTTTDTSCSDPTGAMKLL